MSSSEPVGSPAPRRSPLFGVSKTRIRALDEGIKKTLQNAIDRWIEKRVSFIESLPQATQQELSDDGLLSPPQVEIPGSRTAQQRNVLGRQPLTGLSGANHLRQR